MQPETRQSSPSPRKAIPPKSRAASPLRVDGAHGSPFGTQAADPPPSSLPAQSHRTANAARLQPARWPTLTATWPWQILRRVYRGLLAFRWFDPHEAERLARYRFDQLDTVLGTEAGRVVTAGHRNRATRRVELSEDDAPRVWYVKLEPRVRWKHILRGLLSGRGFWSRSRWEFETLCWLRRHGIVCPRPVACMQAGVLRPRATLIVEELSGFVALPAFLAADPFAVNHLQREQFFATLGREVARLHATGCNQPDLYTTHVLVDPQTQPHRIAFIDFQRSTIRHGLPLRLRVRDLAALLATLPERLAGGRDRELFIDAYLAEAQLEDRASQVIAGVVRRSQRLLARRKIWEIRESHFSAARPLSELEASGRGNMWIDPAFRPHLERAGLAHFEAMMSTTAGHCLRALADRENWRLELDDGHDRCGAYLKKHHTRSLSSRLRAWLGSGPGETPGRIEARNVARLQRGGINAMRLIAFGEKLHRDGLLESFVLTEELAGFTQLDHFLRRRFAARAAHRTEPTRRDADLLRLIDRVADVAARFHRLGYNHRDLYCCHFFIREPTRGEFQVNLIDLQRVEHRQRLRRRWLVKDLAQLSYSAPRDRIGCTHKMAFIRRYLGVRKLRPQDKRFIREILAKHQTMETHLGPHP